MTQGPTWIDVHHHLIPPAFVTAAKRHGLKKVAGATLPAWTPDKSLHVMDTNGIHTAVLSLSAPGVNFSGRKQAVGLARACNEYAVDVRQKNPGRFGNFAVLPMPFTDEACREAVYAIDELKADGVVLLGSTDGYFLGDPRFDELMAELNKRGAVVFVHPNLHPTSDQIGLNIPGFFVEFLCDTTRAATNMIFKGTLHRYPDIKFILAHAGGFLPYIAWRLSLANDMPKLAKKFPSGMMHSIGSFYYDTALSPSPYAMSALRQLVDPTHILFGSDFPFAPSPAVRMEVSSVRELTTFSEPELVGVTRTNAASLFPSLSLALRTPVSSSVGTRIRKAVGKPVAALADAFRKR